jgi:hypothetical protein
MLPEYSGRLTRGFSKASAPGRFVTVSGIHRSIIACETKTAIKMM